MASLEWQSDATEQSEQNQAHAHRPATSSTKTIDPWFPAAMGLLGVIVGYLIGS